MNKYEAKHFELIEALIPSIQGFLDKNIVGDKAMTAAVIAEKFIKENKCQISQDDFVTGFRLAVREGSLKGIVGVRKAGYRRTDAAHSTVKAVDKTLGAFVPYVEKVQILIDKYVQGITKMTAAAIYHKFLAENGICDLDEEEFIKGFRLALHEGKLTGLCSAGRWGYKRGDSSSEEEEDNEEEDSPEEEEVHSKGCEVIIDDTHKLTALDDKNWGYQIRKASGIWSTVSYFGNSVAMVSSLARRMIDEQWKTSDSFDIHQLEQKLKEMEARITQLLRTAMGDRDWGRVCNKLNLPATSKPEEVFAAIQSLIDAVNISTQTLTEEQQNADCN